ncbi:hypothetical protein EGW08_022075 [Elysia chlorotica]|uniref:Uncharacterized protein n=1 Tax=Elysia chlorotica TaxID=188477 RepID=A0A3S0ZLI4_ELYCH|nr:hypothetical protein EGW08_022075 [Elysia chlorotica]
MAYHFRKLKNSLRLLPTSKTLGFSTRLYEGDSHNLLAVPGINPEDSAGSVATNQGLSDLLSRSLKHMGRSDPGISHSESDLDLAGRFLPAIVSKPGNVLPLPVTYEDLAQVLRLPAPLSADKDLISDVRSILRVVYPTSDDILFEMSQVAHNKAFNDYSTTSFTDTSSDAEHSSENISVEVFDMKDRHDTVRQSWSAQMSAIPSTTADCLSSVMNSHSVQTLSSSCDHDCRLPSLFSPSFPDKAESSHLSSSNGASQGKGSGKGGPSPEQMNKIKEKLENAVCKLFSGRQDYTILHKNVVLENNLFGDNKTTVGLLAYGIEILKLRLRIHARFSNTSVELQSVTMLEQNGVVRIHWRLKGLSQIQTLKFWRLFQSKTAITKDDYEWLEAFSYFHIGKDGLVHKHRIDRMISDDTSGTEKITNTLRELLNPAKPLVS